jgi:prephenate dehydrogenase
VIRFERVAVLGLGLLGGSVAAAARRAGIADCVAGATRSAEARQRALANGWVDEATDPAQAVAAADLVVLATPLFAMADIVGEIAPALSDGAILTDVGSVKAPLTETLPGLLPSGVVYVGSHPIAGSHERGIDFARADLFQGAACVVTGEAGSEPCERVSAFWRALGSNVVLRAPDQHDTEVAWTSHVPHVLAYAFASAFGAAPAGTRAVTGGGFRDFTRIAQSDPELWCDILTANRKALAAPLAAVAERVGELARAIEANDTESVERAISEARDALAGVAAGSEDPSQEETNGSAQQ